ncbi:MAG: polysaccharide biosynthesis C-terminal domain-containing protein [Bacteroidales bacterium]|nr:polysaccharide biosynthesis C-terminal domain-containing protein [Bacteroidales bacterium]
MLCFSFYVLADTFFIARALGANGLTGLNLSISVFSVLQGLALMIGVGGATQYTILKSRNETANSIFTYSLFIGLCVAIIFVIIGLLLTTSLAKMLGADKATLPLTVTYMRTILYFSPALILNTILILFVRNDNNPKLAMAGMVTGSFSNIVLDYIFLFPLSMGMFGAALATGLSLILGIIVLSLHFLRKSNQLNLCKCKIHIKKIINIFLSGFSAMIGELSFAISLITFNLVILRIEGNIGVAAYGIVANIALILISLFTGVAQGIQPLISKGHGSGNNILVKQTIKYAIALVFLLAIAMYGLTYFYSTVIVTAFNSEVNISLALLAQTGMKIYFIGLIFAGMNIVTASFFSAAGNSKKGIIISLLRSCVIIIPLVILLSTIFKMNGIWFSFVLTEFVVCVLSIVFLYKKLKNY